MVGARFAATQLESTSRPGRIFGPLRKPPSNDWRATHPAQFESATRKPLKRFASFRGKPPGLLRFHDLSAKVRFNRCSRRRRRTDYGCTQQGDPCCHGCDGTVRVYTGTNWRDQQRSGNGESCHCDVHARHVTRLGSASAYTLHCF